MAHRHYTTHTHTHTQQQHLLCGAGLCVAEVVAQYGLGVGITHGGVDLNLLVLQTDRFCGDPTCERQTEPGLRRAQSRIIINTHTLSNCVHT